MEQLQRKWGGVGAFKVQSFLLFLRFQIVALGEYFIDKALSRNLKVCIIHPQGEGEGDQVGVLWGWKIEKYCLMELNVDSILHLVYPSLQVPGQVMQQWDCSQQSPLPPPGAATLELPNARHWGRKKRANAPSSIHSVAVFIYQTFKKCHFKHFECEMFCFS